MAAALPGPGADPAQAGASPGSSRGLLVGFTDLPADELEDGRWANGTVAELLPALEVARIRPDDPDRFRRTVPGRDEVAYVERDAAVSPAFVPDDPLYPDQYAPGEIGLLTAWNATLGDAEVRVGVVDSGIRDDHEDLQGAVAAGEDFAEDDGTAQDACGHGTAVAGIAGARTDNGTGVAGAADVSLLDAKGLGHPDLPGCQGYLSDLADAIRWSVDQGARVVSMSWGSSTDSSTLRRAVEYASNQGALPVAAAGNAGDCSDCVAYPAAYEEVVAVTCTRDDEEICSFSSTGPEAEFAAPGTSILTTDVDGGYTQFAGTSASAPFVSGTAALVASAEPNVTRSGLRDVLRTTAHDLGPDGRDNEYGFGEVAAGGAVDAVADMPPDARFTASCVSLVCTYDASPTTDVDTDEANLTYTWHLGDGNGTQGEKVRHVYARGGTYDVTLEVSDGNSTRSAVRTVDIQLEVRLEASSQEPAYGVQEDPVVLVQVIRLGTGEGLPDQEVTVRTRWAADDLTAPDAAERVYEEGVLGPACRSYLRDAGLLCHRATGTTDAAGVAAVEIPGEAGSGLRAPTPGHHVVARASADVAGVHYEATATYDVDAR